MASGLLIKQKQLLAGDGIAINHGETASTISLAENALDNAVRIYDATVEKETGVITITDGTQVSELAIGDEIRTPDGVYQKIKDNITTTGSADGSRIEVSGITSPAEANGLYILTETDSKWKHESADYWISSWNNAYYWMISAVEDAANPGSSLFYGYMASQAMPWEVTSWTSSSGAAGTPVVENTPVEQVITNTIDLFEYASLPVEPENIVQSVNGNKPDASGNVTIEAGSSIDESRLLPENPADGDIPVFDATATTGGGNDESVKLLIQPETSDGEIIDQAHGNAAPVAINQGNAGNPVTVDENHALSFPGNGSYISIPVAGINQTIDGNSEFCIDLLIKPEWQSGTRKLLHLGADGWYAYMNPGAGTFWFFGKGNDNMQMGLKYNEEHLLTLEQWKDGETWKMSWYTDGSLRHTFDNSQVGAATADMRFGIGDNDEGGGFLGTMNNIRLRNIAPYRGVSFSPDNTPYTVPQVVGEWKAKPAKELVSDAIDKSRLLPESPDNGDVPVFNAAVTEGGGNDETTKFLLQPLAGESSIVDTAEGAVTPVEITVNGTVKIGEEGGMQFNGAYGSDSSITIPANALPSEIFDGEHDFTIDIVYTADSTATGRQCLFGKGEPPGRFDFLLSTNGDLECGGGPSLGSAWPFDVKVRLTFEVYKQGEAWNYTCFRDGAVITSGTWTNNVEWRQNFQPIGSDGYQRYFKGTIWAFRITAGAPHKGQAFAPDPLPWTVPQVVGAWENQNLNEQIDSKIATHNADPSAHPDKLSLTGGQMTGELKLGASNALRLNNKDGYGVILRKDANNFYILVTAQNDENGAYTESRPLEVNLATGVCSINGGALTDSTGNVITTTYAPLNHPTFSGGVEITGTTPYIDFHFNNSESDYTFRIVQNSEDTLTLGGKVAVSNTLSVTSGGLSVAGSITSTGEILSNTTNSFRLIYGDYGAFWRNDGRDLYLMLTAAGDPTGSYNSLRPLTVDFATGVCDISGSALETETNLANTGIYPSASMNTTQTSDFNTFLTQGVYWMPNGVHPNGPLGSDSNCTGVLCVYTVRNTHYVQVFYMRTGTGEGNHIMYYRWQYSGTWTNWMTISGNNELATGTANYNDVTSPGSYYFSRGDNTSNVNAPANGPFHLIVHRYYNAEGTANPILQIAIPQIVSAGQTATIYIRTASWSNNAYTWQPWTKLITEDILEAVGVYPTSSVEPNLNFNTALTQGFYFANGANCTNGPFTGASNNQGWVTVRAIPNGNHALQFFYGFNTDDFFVRRYTNNAWASWRRITTNAASVPNVGSAVDCTSALKSSAGYTCPSNGWIYADGTQLNINGGNFYTDRLPMVPVMSGDVVKCSYATIGEFYKAR